MKYEKSLSDKLLRYVDGEADTFFEFFMLTIVLINTITLGLETSQDILAEYGKYLFLIDQICLWIFIFEILIKIVAFNKCFFGNFKYDRKGDKYFHLNKWNVFDLFIIVVSIFGSLPFFSIFRVLRIFRSIKIIKAVKSFRVIKTFKLVNGITSLRVMVKAIVKAFPSVLWTFFLLIIFAYVYGIVGNSIFGSDFPDYFGNLKLSFLSLFGLTSVDSAEIIAVYNWAWIYFVSYNFFEASIIMNVIVGVIVEAVNNSREEISKEDDVSEKLTLEDLSEQIERLRIELLKNQIGEKEL